MRSKKLLALGLASVMMLSTTTVAFAASTEFTTTPAGGTAAGTGDIEGYVNKDVFTVSLPTTADLSFKIDPQELMLAVDSGKTLKIDNVTNDGAGNVAGYGEKVLFGTGTTYTTKSADITILNKSTFAVDVTVDAKVNGLSEADYEIKLEDKAKWGTDPAISLAVTATPDTYTFTDGSGEYSGTAQVDTTTAITEEGVKIPYTVDVSAQVAGAYEVTGTTSSYAYKIKTDANIPDDTVFNAVTFNLTGEVNNDAACDWTKFNEADSKKLAVELVYSVEKHVAPPTLDVSTMSTDGLVSVEGLSAKKNYKGLVFTAEGTDYSIDSAPTAEWGLDNYSETDGGDFTVTLPQDWLAFFDGKGDVTVTLELTDGTTLEETVSFPATP